jgi:exo-beta-1,3-glucanase (GH17 family)
MNKLIFAGLAALALSQGCGFSFVGVNYGPWHKSNQAPPNPIPDSQFQSDLAIISKRYSYIRTYEVADKSRMDQLVPYIAKNLPSMKVFLGVWESNDDPRETQKQLQTAINLAKTYPNIVECIVVGNEARVDITQLIYDIKEVKKAVPNVKVTSCLTFGEAMTNGERLMRESPADFFMLNAYPFFVPKPIGEAKANTVWAYGAAKTKALGRPVIFGELGWPSAGPANGPAEPSVANQKQYIGDVTDASTKGNWDQSSSSRHLTSSGRPGGIRMLGNLPLAFGTKKATRSK